MLAVDDVLTVDDMLTVDVRCVALLHCQAGTTWIVRCNHRRTCNDNRIQNRTPFDSVCGGGLGDMCKRRGLVCVDG